ncbi:MAG TPA: AAC(3) family N-acetyltransferase [Chloroflexota bacterium]|nr:AAC(3) family N-acetyltransferase [Chloroflexota bacterium]
MSEASVIFRSPQPFSSHHLAQDLRRLGVKPGMTLLVHSSLSRIGYVPGGPVAVIQALQEVLTDQGTLVMPTHSSDLSDPANWQNPPIPDVWHEAVREIMPAYDPAVTPTRGMGVIPETFRCWPGVRRSDHPQTSFAAWGKQAVFVTAHHALEMGLGEQSPLARIYDLDGDVLLMGVGHANNTSFHLGEVRSGVVSTERQGAPIMEDGRRVWKWYADYTYDADDFTDLGADFEREESVTLGQVGVAECRLFAQRTAVDYAQWWIRKNRDA